MRFALMIEAQMGLSYEDQLAIVRRAESAGRMYEPALDSSRFVCRNNSTPCDDRSAP